ncbi:hypothetical protein [Microvirga zambiensis]|uniref:hypothetical protein n=1 Tax=Microvirga zambiensis TaxID=1402137 RepID=UPI00191FE56D|nr:hypothetical protein [Microvirga zambiensis]
MTLPKDDIVWLWNTTDLSASRIGRKFGLTKGVVLGIVHRDPRAKMRRPPTPMQMKDRRIKALEAEVVRLQTLEAQLARTDRKAAA